MLHSSNRLLNILEHIARFIIIQLNQESYTFRGFISSFHTTKKIQSFIFDTTFSVYSALCIPISYDLHMKKYSTQQKVNSLEPPVCDKTTDECLLPCHNTFAARFTYWTAYVQLKILFCSSRRPMIVAVCECSICCTTYGYDDNCFSTLCHVRPLVKFLF